MVEGTEYGEFNFVAFVLPEPKDVRSYVDNKHPIVLTLNGQNHGEMTRTVIVQANMPELSSSMIVEVRLDGLEQEALSHIITNSRETPKQTAFTRSLTQRLIELLGDDDILKQLERQRQDEKVKQSNEELNTRLSQFMRQILSDARTEPTARSGGTAPGKGGRGSGEPRPEVPASDPPRILEFLSNTPLRIPEGTTCLAKFKSDARPPKFAFGGDNPRLFGTFQAKSDLGARVRIVGHALLAEDRVSDFGTYLMRFKEALQLPEEDCAYWGERYEQDGISTLVVEVNAANPQLVGMFEDCINSEERVRAKERYCRDVVLDCYQHSFRLHEVPEAVWAATQTDQGEAQKAAEMFLNHDKAIRFATRERDDARRKASSVAVVA